MNRNWESELDIPVGAANRFSPGQEDRGQPTRFLPRRNRFTFKVPVPEGFGPDDELVWSLTVNGLTESAYASLREDYLVDNVVIMSETGSLGNGTSTPEIRANTPPLIELETGSRLRTRVGEPVTLIARVVDDGVPSVRTLGRRAVAGEEQADQTPLERAFRRALSPPRRTTVGKTNGLHLSWFVYRGSGPVHFDPIQIKSWEDTRAGANSPWAPLWEPPLLPEDGRWVATAVFEEAGTYLLRGRADDGGLYADVQVEVTVE
jgi:hypothetical protein